VLRDATADPGGCIVGLANIAGGEVVAIEASGLLLQTGFTAAQTAVLMSKGALALFDKPTGKVGVIIDAEVCGHTAMGCTRVAAWGVVRGGAEARAAHQAYDGTAPGGHSEGDLVGSALSNMECGPAGTATIRPKFNLSTSELVITGGGGGPSDLLIKKMLLLSPDQLAEAVTMDGAALRRHPGLCGGPTAVCAALCDGRLTLNAGNVFSPIADAQSPLSLVFLVLQKEDGTHCPLFADARAVRGPRVYGNGEGGLLLGADDRGKVSMD
jgi:hypothetical protein